MAHELSGLQRNVGLWMMQELRSLLGAIGLSESADEQLQGVIDAARSDLSMTLFRDLLLSTRWRRAPEGLSLTPDAKQVLTVWLDAAKALWGDPGAGGCGWLHRLVHGAAGGEAAYPECLVPRVVDPLAYRVHLEVPEFLRQPPEVALRDPASALGAVNELAQHCRAGGATTGARGAAWSCIAAMSSRRWSSLAALYPGLSAVRAEGVLSITLLVRVGEMEGLVSGVPGGRVAAPSPSMVVVITDDEFEAIDAWRIALADVAESWQHGGYASKPWINSVRITLSSIEDVISAARAVRAGGSGDLRDEEIEGAVRRLENSQLSFSQWTVRAVEGALAAPRHWPDELGESWVASSAISVPVHSFRLSAGDGRDPWSGGAPRFFLRDADGTRRQLW